jgi:hypothetical protein
MTEMITGTGRSDAVLTECVRTATLAPSLHNSQPWRFRISDGAVEVYADPSRRLDVLDPDGREMHVSVGAALFTLRLAIRRTGVMTRVQLLPDPAEPDLVARVVQDHPEAVPESVRELAAAIDRRHTNRWPFEPSVLPADVIEKLTLAARAEGANLGVAGAVSRTAILGLSRMAEQTLQSHGGYRAELGRWTQPGAGRHDGIPASAIGPWDAMERLPIRDFGLLAPRVERSGVQFEAYPTIMVLTTEGDTPRQWLQAGQALQRTLLVATSLHLSNTPISQPVEIPAVRELLCDTSKGVWAQMVLRLGYGRPAATTPRRPLAEVLLPETRRGSAQ